MEELQQEFEKFMADLEARLENIGITLSDCLIDHVCYRVATADDFNKLGSVFKNHSKLYSELVFHERGFYVFLTSQPFKYKDHEIYTLEFSEPGGSDDYTKGFQHIEILTKKSIENISRTPEETAKLLVASKHGDENYLKWPDKLVVKGRSMPVIIHSLMVDGGSPRINQ